MLLVLKIARFCTMDNPKDRPDTKNASRIIMYQIINEAPVN
jgi:hypothetical protein